MFRSEPSQHFGVDQVPTLEWTESEFLRGPSPLFGAVNHKTSPKLYRFYYPHRLRELVSPMCGIFFKILNCQNLSFWVFSHFQLGSIIIQVFEFFLLFFSLFLFEFCHNISLKFYNFLCFRALSQSQFIFVAIWVFKFCHNLSFRLFHTLIFFLFFLQFQFLILVITWVFEFSHNFGWIQIWGFKFYFFQYEFCHNSKFWSFWVVTI